MAKVSRDNRLKLLTLKILWSNNIMCDLLTKDSVFVELGFNEKWIESGVVNDDIFLSIKQNYLEEPDHRYEHYRWGAFKNFFSPKKKFDKDFFYCLYEIGKNDPDYYMGRAIIFDIMKHEDYPLDLLEFTVNDSDSTLVKHALKCIAFRNNQMP
jgi:hypothetical protein